ncbi:MAG: hypothetical protein LBQ24_06500 [Candidatus Peribacteria bacterium]|nr:hypothetical protein [Candidatus Peribacteria bacterium]
MSVFNVPILVSIFLCFILTFSCHCNCVFACCVCLVPIILLLELKSFITCSNSCLVLAPLIFRIVEFLSHNISELVSLSFIFLYHSSTSLILFSLSNSVNSSCVSCFVSTYQIIVSTEIFQLLFHNFNLSLIVSKTVFSFSLILSTFIHQSFSQLHQLFLDKNIKYPSKSFLETLSKSFFNFAKTCFISSG